MEDVRRAVEGIDVVVHMAADPSGRSWESLRDNNLIGTYNIFEASREAGVSRIVAASTIQVSTGDCEHEPYKSIVEGREEDVPAEVVPKLFLCGVEMLEGIRYWGQWAMTGSNHRADVPRRTFITVTGQAAAGLLFAAFANGMTRGRHGYHVRRHEVPMAGLPDRLDGLRIVQVSDAHLGSFLGQFEAVQPGLDMIRSLDPDILCFTGDLVNDHSDEAEPWIERFKALEGRYGKFSILGNHDYADYARRTDEEREVVRSRIRAIHEEMGFDLLLDEHRVLEINGEKLLLAGVQNWGRGFRQSGDLGKALQDSDTELPTVLLSHDPTHWEDRVMGGKAPVELTLSGHTHGMQMGLELPALGIKFSPSRLRYKRWGGLYTEGKQHLHVNRGFGMLGFPGRIGMPPEITELTLRKA